MPSTYKTPNYGLNKWTGSDKPKMDDFNLDNEKLDAALGAHAANATLHLSEEEHGWLRAPMEYGSYSGDGTSPRQVTVGFKPKFLLVYAVGQPLIYYDWNYRTADLYSGVATENGASMGITLSDTGFSVENVEDSVIGVGPILNQTGKTYAWMALR